MTSVFGYSGPLTAFSTFNFQLMKAIPNSKFVIYYVPLCRPIQNKKKQAYYGI